MFLIPGEMPPPTGKQQTPRSNEVNCIALRPLLEELVQPFVRYAAGVS